MATRKGRGRSEADEAAALRATLEEILKHASRRFEGQSCPRCLAIESLAPEALRASAKDETSPISLPELNGLLERKRKPTR